MFCLAFPIHFCHAGSVRKYLLLPLFILSTYIFFFSVMPSYAAGNVKEGGKCNTSGTGLGGADATTTCVEGLYCKPNGGGFGIFTSTEGICSKKQVVKCSCKNANQDSSAGNGVNQIDCGTGTQPIYCSNNQTCAPAADANTPANGSIDFKDQGDSFKDKTVTGVSCTPNKKVATCTCDPTDKHKFNCAIDGKQNAGSGSCKDTNAECGAASDINASTDTTTTTSYSGGLTTGFDIKGVTCTPPKAQCTCENSGAAASGQNGFNCTLNGQTVHDFCEHQDSACTTASGSAMQGGGGSKSKPFNGATLEGIKCGVPGTELSPAPTEPPPPSPPCATWGANGQCTSFGTAFGALATDPAGFVKTLFAVLLSFSGGIALLLIIRAGYSLLTSQGKPEAINQARDQLVAAIVGLVFLIFAFVVLETIGVDILHLPGFQGSGG